MGSCISVEIETDKADSGRHPKANGDVAKNTSSSKNATKSTGSKTTGGNASKSAFASQDSFNTIDAGGGGGPPPARRFKYKELQAATNSFDDSLVLGEGSFGKVFEGHLEDSPGKDPSAPGTKTTVAIKKLNPESFQGYEEWLAEVLLLDKLRHPNLVRLVGYCAERGEALLAYELCPNGSLDQNLFEENGKLLTWEQRVGVALDAARGLAYLHENNVIHRDFKASNILLAEDFSARLTDFGMARAGPDGNETHISTRVMGTMGYLDPTYMETGRLTRKSDTYAFGVMLLELLTGRRTMGDNGQESLTAWIRPYLSQRKPDLNLLVDPRLNNEYSKAGAVKMAILAKHCIHDDPGYRPEMSTLAENLELVDTKDA